MKFSTVVRSDCKPMPTSMDSGNALVKPPNDYDASADMRKGYKSAVGSLIGNMLRARPDIADAILGVSDQPYPLEASISSLPPPRPKSHENQQANTQMLETTRW